MRKISLILPTILATQFAFSQEIPTINNTDENTNPIVLCDLHISVFVMENIAKTTMEMRFYNDNDQVMEGEFNFPLADGVTVSRFALDVNGEMREGVVVDKEKATQAFEAITRRNVDPGLAEVTKGNNFKARVYPIPANGHKKAIVAFEQAISGDVDNYIYQLPLQVKHQLQNFSVRVEVVMNKPKVIKSDHPNINLEFKEVQNSYISEHIETNVILDSHLTFTVPKPKKTEKVVTYQGSVTSDNYFYINLNINPEQRRKNKPDDITVIWDVSASAKNRDLEKELSILKNYLSWMKTGNIDLITFSNTIHKRKSYQNANGQCEQLINDLKAEYYDGGTNMNAIDFSKLKTAEVLLFSDGISNFGEKNTTTASTPILAINSSNIADHNLLEHIATSANGSYINAFKATVDQAVDLATHQQKQFIRAEFDKEKITDVFPKTAQTVIDHFSLSGKMEGATSPIILHFGFGNEVTESHTITVDNSKSIADNLGERIWAQKKLKTLMVDNNRPDIIAHGTKFSLVTPGTSLIVLDAIEDYVQYEIVPPPSLQKEYFNIISTRDQKNNEDRESRIKNLCESFNEDIKWWENVVDYRSMAEIPPKESEIQKAENIASPAMPEIAAESIERHYDLSIASEQVEDERNMEAEEFAQMGNANSKKSMEKTYSATLEIHEWDSNAPYINSLKSVDTKDVYAKYLSIKSKYEDNPSFYFDVATYMFQKSLRAEGLRVISNLVELELENTEIMRTLGRKLFEFEFYTEAISVFDDVLQLRSFEPHSYIDLGLSYAEKGDYQKAIDNLYMVIDKSWDRDIISRFPGIELIVLHDMNNIIFHHKKKVNLSAINPCFVVPMPVDVRVVIDWDANDTDIDLWITDPREEKCSYQNKNTKIGGKISNDITRGYGPEEFRLKHAIEGKYIVEANFYSSSKQTALGMVTVRAIVYTNFGTDKEQKEVLTLQLEPSKSGEYVIGELDFSR